MNRDARTVLLLCVAAIFSMTGFSSWPALLPELQAAWGLSGTAAGAIAYSTPNWTPIPRESGQ